MKTVRCQWFWMSEYVFVFDRTCSRIECKWASVFRGAQCAGRKHQGLGTRWREEKEREETLKVRYYPFKHLWSLCWCICIFCLKCLFIWFCKNPVDTFSFPIEHTRRIKIKASWAEPIRRSRGFHHRETPRGLILYLLSLALC